MAMAGTVTSPSWNPLRCDGTALPVNLLIMAKVIAIALLLTNHVRLLPEPFLPFIPWLDQLPGIAFQRTIQVVFVTAAVALLFNRSVRLSALLLGLTMIISVVASKAYYGNNKTYCGFVLFLIGIYEPRTGPWLVRLQVALVYFGAGLNKLLDTDWRTGVFFENWAVNRLHQPVYIGLSTLLPALWMARVVSWFTIATELSLSGLLISRRLIPLAIWLSISLHSGMLFFTGSTFTMFFYAMTASMLAFITWPTERLIVIFDGDCGFCARAKGWMERFDFEGRFRWLPYQSGAGHALGVSDADASQRVYLVNGTTTYSGFAAFKMMVLWNPAAYLIVYAILAAPGAKDSFFRNVTVALLLFLFSPVFGPIGEAAYRLVARNRHMLSGSGPSCSIEPATSPSSPQRP